MEAILHEHGIQIQSKDLIVALSEKFSQSAERVGKMNVQVKQVWNWFHNRRFAVRSKMPRPLSKSPATTMPPDMAMPKAAFQLGVKMQDGRKTRNQNKDQKITNELHKINKIYYFEVLAQASCHLDFIYYSKLVF